MHCMTVQLNHPAGSSMAKQAPGLAHEAVHCPNRSMRHAHARILNPKAHLQRVPRPPSMQQHGAQAQAHGRKLALWLHVAQSVLGRHRRPQPLLCTLAALTAMLGAMLGDAALPPLQQHTTDGKCLHGLMTQPCTPLKRALRA